MKEDPMSGLKYVAVALVLVFGLAPALSHAEYSVPNCAGAEQTDRICKAPILAPMQTAGRQIAAGEACASRCYNRRSSCMSRCKTQACASNCAQSYRSCLIGCSSR
jgi:hypothetical protein